MAEKIVFSTRRYAPLAEAVAKGGNMETGQIELTYFPDGERYQRIRSEVDGRAIVLIGGTVSDSDTLELYDLAYTLVSQGAASLLLIIPYFGYSTMERAVKQGEVVTAKTRAYLLSSIPSTSLGNRVILLDLHTEGLPYYFEGRIRAIHLYAKALIADICQQLCGHDFVLASTDAGRAKWVESLANDMGVNGAFVFKRRLSGEQTQITSINADVRDRPVIIYDDMIRTGGSLLSAVRAYKEAGAGKVYVVTTHGLFIGQSLERIQQSGLVEKMACTDSHPNALPLASDFLEVRSIAGLLLEEIRRH